jgi:hypothetical protein
MGETFFKYLNSKFKFPWFAQVDIWCCIKIRRGLFAKHIQTLSLRQVLQILHLCKSVNHMLKIFIYLLHSLCIVQFCSYLMHSQPLR